MYKMKADGVVFYDPSSEDKSLHVLKPNAKYELNKIDELTFTMLPNNVMYNSLNRMTTIITLEQDGEEIFRGRVMETTTDTYKRREVYCEGEMSYLCDSCVRPYEYKGKAKDLFVQLVTLHNEQVDEHKRFEVGIITAIDDDTETETDSQAYANTLSELRQMFVTVHKGYLRVRYVDGIRYLDYLKDYEEECGQAIEFGVNLVDIKNKIDAGEVFSVLIPLGGYNTQSRNDPVNIKSVNDGKDYIEDAEALARYGRIVKTYKWEDCKDPQELKDRAFEQFKKMKEHRTITIKAVDLHIIDTSVDAIRLGKRVKLLSSPHELNEPDVCSKIDLKVEKPDQTEYTFGFPPETLTDSNTAKNIRRTSEMNHFHRWLTETESALNILVDVTDDLGLRATQLEIDVDDAEAAITLKASLDYVSILEEKHNTVALRLDAAENAIMAKADLILLDGYVLAKDLATGVLSVLEDANIDSIHAQSLAVDGNSSLHGSVNVGGDVYVEGDVSATSINGAATAWTSKEVVTGVNYQLETATTPPFYNANGTQVSAGIPYVKNVIITPVKETINFLGKE